MDSATIAVVSVEVVVDMQEVRLLSMLVEVAVEDDASTIIPTTKASMVYATIAIIAGIEANCVQKNKPAVDATIVASLNTRAKIVKHPEKMDVMVAVAAIISKVSPEFFISKNPHFLAQNRQKEQSPPVSMYIRPPYSGGGSTRGGSSGQKIYGDYLDYPSSRETSPRPSASASGYPPDGTFPSRKHSSSGGAGTSSKHYSNQNLWEKATVSREHTPRSTRPNSRQDGREEFNKSSQKRPHSTQRPEDEAAKKSEFLSCVFFEILKKLFKGRVSDAAPAAPWGCDNCYSKAEHRPCDYTLMPPNDERPDFIRNLNAEWTNWDNWAHDIQAATLAMLEAADYWESNGTDGERPHEIETTELLAARRELQLQGKDFF